MDQSVVTQQPQMQQPQYQQQQQFQQQSNHPSQAQMPMIQMMPMMAVPMGPLPIPGCPSGFEYLVGTSDLLVQQEVEVMEAMIGWLEMPNKYSITNSFGQRIYYAGEQGVQGYGMGRGFVITIFDCFGRPIITFDRPYDSSYGECASSCNCSGRSGTYITAIMGDGTVLGQVVHEPNGTTPLMVAYDDQHNPVARIIGQDGIDCCCSQPGACGAACDFDIFPVSGQPPPIGRISKQWGGFIVEQYTNADTFGVSFHPDLNVRIKALLLGAVFLIDFMFFEKRPDTQRSRRGRRHNNFGSAF